MDVNTRRLRYLVTVAEELHFGRAAERHFIAQQAMSRQIRDLEEQVGASLLERTTRRVALTPAGASLLQAARDLLAALDEGVDTARALSRTSAGMLRIGFRFSAALELTAPILAALDRDHPGIEVELRELDFRTPVRTYDNGSFDVAILRSPIDLVESEADGSEIEIVPLLREPRVAAIGERHPLGSAEQVTLADLGNVPIVVGDFSDDAWLRYWTLEEERGEPPVQVVRASSQGQEWQLVATGRACAVTVASAARYMPYAGVKYIPIVMSTVSASDCLRGTGIRGRAGFRGYRLGGERGGARVGEADRGPVLLVVVAAHPPRKTRESIRHDARCPVIAFRIDADDSRRYNETPPF